MRKTIEIQCGLVFICGPSSGGKTTLAQRIMNEAPYPKKVLLLHDQMLCDYIMDHSRPLEEFFTGLDDYHNRALSASVIRSLHSGLANRKFVVFEGCYCDEKRLASLLELMPAIGLDRPLTLIKICLPWSIHKQRIEQRLNGDPADWNEMLTKYQEFQKIMAMRYSEKLKYIKEYSLSQQCDIKLEFRPAKAMTNQLMAAYGAHQAADEGASDFRQAVVQA